MANRDDEWMKRELERISPGVKIPNPLDYLIDADGRVYRWPPGGERWVSTGEVKPAAAEALRSGGGFGSQPVKPWSDIIGRPVYQDPRSTDEKVAEASRADVERWLHRND
jgi:hypothetical protein